MRILVFGSTGKAGREAVRQALERWHAVIAYARNPGMIDFRHEALTMPDSMAIRPVSRRECNALHLSFLMKLVPA